MRQGGPILRVGQDERGCPGCALPRDVLAEQLAFVRDQSRSSDKRRSRRRLSASVGVCAYVCECVSVCQEEVVLCGLAEAFAVEYRK